MTTTDQTTQNTTATNVPTSTKRWVWSQCKIEKLNDTKHLVFECEGGSQEYVYVVDVANEDEFMYVAFNSGSFKVYDTVDELLDEIKERMPKPAEATS